MNKIIWKRIGIACLAVFALSVSFFAGFYVNAQKSVSELSVTDVTNKDLSKPTGVDFATFWTVWNTLNDKFVKTGSSTALEASTTLASQKVLDDTQTRVYGAIKGMVDSLDDPYTTFFTPAENNNFETELSGSLEGVGIEVGIKDGFILVISPLKGSPADKAGVLAGDKIIQIDSTPTSGLDINSAINLLRGKSGTTVKLTLARDGKPDPVVVSITRDTIDIPVIDTQKITESKTFVIKIYSFSSNSPALFRNALRDFVDSGYSKLIIDLRNNPGGYLEAAVDMGSWFLPSGKTIVTEDYGKKQDPDVYKSYGYDIFNNNLKMAILINSGSASASEILAGALSEYKIGTLIGEKSFGKGSVQELVPITGGGALKVTIARWLTPLGKSISEEGLTPEYEVKMTDDDVKAGKDPQMDKAIQILNSK